MLKDEEKLEQDKTDEVKASSSLVSDTESADKDLVEKDIKEDERKSWASHAAENFALVDDAIIFVVENCTIKSERALNYNEVAWVDILKCCS